MQNKSPPKSNAFLHYFSLIFAGALFSLGFAPLGLWPLTLCSLAFFYFKLRSFSKEIISSSSQNVPPSLRHVFLSGFSYGLGLFGMGVSWVYVSMHDYGYMPVWLAVPATFLFVAFISTQYGFFALFYYQLKQNRFGIMTFPALWVIFEWCRTWFLKGLPWLFSGYAFIDTPLSVFAPILGVWGLSFICVLIITCCFELFIFSKKNIQPNINRWFSLLLILILIISYSFLQQQEWTQPTNEKIKVSLIQGNIPQEKKWLPEEKEPTKKLYRDLTLAQWHDPAWHADIVFLPEGALPFSKRKEAAYLAEIEQQAKENKATWITGIPTILKKELTQQELIGEDDYILYNSLIAFGQVNSEYHKQKLVAFGEYIPFDKLIRGLLPFFDLPFSNFSEGKSMQTPIIHYQKGHPYSFAPFICYEIVYPQLVWHAAKDADFLLTNSNDAWFGRSFAAAQHFEMARMRALEHGKMLIRSTNSGITGFIDHKGKVLSTLPLFEQSVLRGEISPVTGKTPYSVTGNLPILLISGAILILSLLMNIYNRTKKPVKIHAS